MNPVNLARLIFGLAPLWGDQRRLNPKSLYLVNAGNGKNTSQIKSTYQANQRATKRSRKAA